jgi:VWFA-related protein
MKRAGLLCLLAMLLLAATPPKLTVAFVAPMHGEPLFGEVEVRLTFRPAGVRVRSVEVYLDGVRVGELTKAPWRLVVDVGDANVEHHIEAVAVDAAGNQASASLRSGTIAVQEQIEVALRPLFVRVERGGEPVRDLTRRDFTIFDDDVRQQLVTFETGDVPFTAVVLLDASASMQGGRVQTAVQAVTAFARSMKPMDEAKLLVFSDRVLLETPFTNASSFLTLGLPALRAGGGTALNDTLYVALARLEPRTGRKVALILSDGVDIESVLSMAAVRDHARRSGVILYWLRLGEPVGENVQAFTPWRDVDAHRREHRLLRDTVMESGGRIVEVGRIEQAQGALAAVLQELREQYVLGYYPSSSRGSDSWHDVRVEVDGGAQVRTHRGYLEP